MIQRDSVWRIVKLKTLGVCLLLLSGCSWHGINSFALPGTHGRGDGAWTVYVQLPNVSTLDRNSRVLVNDVTVGRVANLQLQNGHALVTVRLDRGVQLPANVVATIGQTTLLGSTHLELSAPKNTVPVGNLANKDTVLLENSGQYPTTEQTMATVAALLGGGNIGQLHEISSELNAALGGRETATRKVLSGLNILVTGLAKQRTNIVQAIDSLDELTTVVAHQNKQLGTAIKEMAPALKVVADRREQLKGALISLGNFSRTANQILAASGDDLRADLAALPNVLQALANSGRSLTESTRYLLTYPFPLDVYANAVRGDYANGVVTLDVRLKTLDNALLLGTPLQGMLTGIEGLIGRAAPPNSTRPAPSLKNMLTPNVKGS